MSYVFNLMILCEIYLVLALAANLVSGEAGLLSMCQAVFYATGAYATAILETRFHFSFTSALLSAVMINVLVAAPVVFFALRLRNLYFTLATLSWQIVVYTLLYNWSSLTNGSIGIGAIPRPVIFGITFKEVRLFVLLGALLTALSWLFFYWFSKTPLSRFIKAVRDDELALMSFGCSPVKFKSIAIVIAAGVSAIAGVLFASYYSYVDPTSFNLNESILILSIVLIGGSGSIAGAVCGAFFYVLLPEILRFVQVPDSVGPNLRMIIYALVLVIVVMRKPNGFLGKFKFS